MVDDAREIIFNYIEESEQECDQVTELLWINLTLLLRKSCSVHMTVFEIVAHSNVNNWKQLLAWCI